jgi:hypothetical protein
MNRLQVFQFVGMVALVALGFLAGRISMPSQNVLSAQVSGQVSGQSSSESDLTRVQNSQSDQAQQPNQNDPRELIPLGPNPGQGPGQGQKPQPGQGQQPGQCPVYLYQDGKLYVLPQPGQQPGQQRGQGPGNQPGQGGGPQELLPLGPNGGGSSPGVPNLPQLPNTPNPFTPNDPAQPAEPNNNRS